MEIGGVESHMGQNLEFGSFHIIHTVCIGSGYANPKSLLTHISKYIWSILTFFFNQKEKVSDI